MIEEVIEYNVGDLVFMPPGESEGRVVEVLDDETVVVRFDRGDYFDDVEFPVALLWHAIEVDDEEEDIEEYA